jgi:hypothetical protein
MPRSLSIVAGSLPGSCGLGFNTRLPQGFHWDTIDTDHMRSVAPQQYAKFYNGNWGHWGYFNDIGPTVIVPDWFLIGVALALSFVPWKKWSWRFTIRTLLIAMTLVAVALGLIVWSINR